jgi:hypothetical protein
MCTEWVSDRGSVALTKDRRDAPVLLISIKLAPVWRDTLSAAAKAEPRSGFPFHFRKGAKS